MSSPNISFDNIPSSIRKPGAYSEFNLNAAQRALPANDISMLIVAQKITAPDDWAGTTTYSVGDKVKPTTANGHYYVCITAGTSAASEPTWPTTAGGTVTDGTAVFMEFAGAAQLKSALVPQTVYSDAEAAAYFGSGSVAHLMAQAAMKANNDISMTIVGVDDDGSGVNATGSIAITGTALAAGTLVVYIGNVRIETTISTGDANTAIATALQASIVEKMHLLPVTPSVASGTVTLTAKNAGTNGNAVPLEASVSSTSEVGLTLTVTDMVSGATDPDLGAASGALDAVYTGEYDIYAMGFNDSDNMSDLKTHLDNISGPTEQRPAIAVIGYTDLDGNSTAVKSLCGTTINHWRITCGYLPNTRSINYEIAGGYAAVLAGEDDPAKPLNNDVIAGIGAPSVENRLSRIEIEDMLDNGVTPLHVVPSIQVAIVRSITTYTRNDQGILDAALLDITTPRSLDYTRASSVSRVSTKFPSPKKTERNKRELKSELLDVLYKLEDLKIVEDVDDWKDYLIIEDDTQDNTRVNARIPAKIVRGMHVIAQRIDLL